MSSFRTLITNHENVALTEEDITRMTRGGCQIKTYSSLKSYTTVPQMFASDQRPIVLLYETKQNFGHWVTLIYRANEHLLEIFDSYGFGKVDAELKYAKYDHTPYLTQIINNTPNVRVSVSNVRLQKMLEHVNTCGRYAVLRVIFRNMSNDGFISMFHGAKLNNPDEIVTAFTMMNDFSKGNK